MSVYISLVYTIKLTVVLNRTTLLYLNFIPYLHVIVCLFYVFRIHVILNYLPLAGMYNVVSTIYIRTLFLETK